MSLRSHEHLWMINEDGMRECMDCGDFDRRVRSIPEPVLRERSELHDALRKVLASLCSIEVLKHPDRDQFEHYCNNHHRVAVDDLICPAVEQTFETALGLVTKYNNGDL